MAVIVPRASVPALAGRNPDTVGNCDPPSSSPWGRLPCPQALVGACWTVGRKNRSSRCERPIRHPPPLATDALRLP